MATGPSALPVAFVPHWSTPTASTRTTPLVPATRRTRYRRDPRTARSPGPVAPSIQFVRESSALERHGPQRATTRQKYSGAQVVGSSSARSPEQIVRLPSSPPVRTLGGASGKDDGARSPRWVGRTALVAKGSNTRIVERRTAAGNRHALAAATAGRITRCSMDLARRNYRAETPFPARWAQARRWPRNSRPSCCQTLAFAWRVRRVQAVCAVPSARSSSSV